MRAVLTSFGSMGDFEPFLALAVEMRRHGHKPVLAYLPQFAARAEKHSIEFVSTGPARMFEDMKRSIKIELASGISDAVEDMQSYSAAAMMQMFAVLQRACKNADLLICSATWPFGRMIHELTGIPYVSVHLDYFNEEFAREGRQAIAAWEDELAAFFEPFFERLKLPRLRHMLTTDCISSQLALFAVSKLMLDPAKESLWPDHHHVTGFFLVEEPEWKPEKRLRDFFEAGDPPVVFTFGSMPYDSADMREAVLETIRRVGCRSILQKGWGELFDEKDETDDVLVTDFVPYSWLMPRVSCVVQAGGAGTSAWALKCGTPTICIPHVWDQISFARLPEANGCGVVIHRNELTPDRLTDALEAVLTEPRYKEAACAVARDVGQEGGARRARELIERWYGTEIGVGLLAPDCEREREGDALQIL